MSDADPTQWMWAQACAMIERAEQMHRQFFRPGVAVPVANWEPPVDLFENNREVLVVVALPGVVSQDLRISLDGALLLVAGIRRLPAAVQGAAIRRLEIPHGRFERRVQLPPGRWELKRSSLENGCLLLSLAKPS
jgi:HSP20 family molecular chaperone IbpA